MLLLLKCHPASYSKSTWWQCVLLTLAVWCGVKKSKKPTVLQWSLLVSRHFLRSGSMSAAKDVGHYGTKTVLGKFAKQRYWMNSISSNQEVYFYDVKCLYNAWWSKALCQAFDIGSVTCTNLYNGLRLVTSSEHREGRGVFWEGPRIFWILSNSFKLFPTHFSRGAKQFLGEALLPLGYGREWT